MNFPAVPRNQLCAACGKKVEKKSAQDLYRTIKKGWKSYCSQVCFRKSQTKYIGLSRRERMHAYYAAHKAKRKALGKK